MENTWITTLIIAALPLLMAITMHEAAHAYAALKLGDSTAADAGRVTLNPLVHIDLVGTILIPCLVLLFSGGKFAFGYAKPVPVNFGRLRHPKRDMLWVAAAGPFANLVMLIFWIVLQKNMPNPPESVMAAAFLQMCFYGIIINLSLMVLNLFPLPPLDGGRIVTSLLPMRLAIPYSRIEPYGFVILLVLLFTELLGKILWPIMEITLAFLYFIF
jgi:Zn-dependent protease